MVAYNLLRLKFVSALLYWLRFFSSVSKVPLTFYTSFLDAMCATAADALLGPIRFTTCDRRRSAGWMTCLVAVSLLAANQADQPEQPEANATEDRESTRDAFVIRIPLPITGSVDERVKLSIDRALANRSSDAVRPILILEFWPKAGQAGEASQYERSLSLARYLTSQRVRRSRTVAFLPQTVKGHAVLVAMACDEIVMHPDAELGEAGTGESFIDPTIRSGYREIADRLRTVPAPLALGMLDKRLVVYKVDVAGGTRYVLDDELDELRNSIAVKSIETVIPADELGSFSGRDLRLKYGVVSRLASDRQELAKILQLPSDGLVEDPSLGGSWRPIQMELKGVVNGRMQAQIQRSLEDHLRVTDINFICFWLDSPGGSPQHSMNLANYLADLDSSQVRTVAYIPKQARSDAALIAFACDHIVMHENAVLGGPGEYVINEDEAADVRESLRENLARKKSRSWSLFAAMIDPDLDVHRYVSKRYGWSEYFCDEELAAQTDPSGWVPGDLENVPGELYRVDGLRAKQLGLAGEVVGGFEEFKQLYHLSDDPALIQPGWAEVLIHALASPQIASVLLFVGAFAMFAELSSPGIGAGGFVAAVCYMLFFWSHALDGTAGWLEILLFLSGAAFVALEIFIIPGFGIFGLGGGVMIVLSLVLASQTSIQIPRNEYQLVQMRNSLLTVAAAIAGVFAGFIVLRRYIHRTPLFQRVTLVPPEGDQLDELNQREAMVNWSRLLGQRGMATTPLSPSGKARFGEDLVDVVSDGQLVAPGTAVDVVEAHGNRVVVKPAKTV